MASIHQKMLVITSICLCLLVAFGNGTTNSTSTPTSNTTSTNTTSTNSTSSNTTSTNTTSTNTTSTNTTSTNTTSTNTTKSNTTSTNTTSSNTTSTNSTGTGTSNTTSTAAANTTSSNTTSSNTTSSNTTASNTTSSNVTASNTTSTNKNTTSNTTSAAASNTTASNTTASNTTASNTTASNTTASNTTASNTTASNTTASNTTASNTTSTNSTGSSTNTSAVSSNSTSASNSTSTTNSTTGNTTGTSSGTAVSSTSAPIATPTKTATVKVKVDQTSIQGTALVIGVIKQNLAAVGAYLDTTKAEYKNFVNAVPKLNDKLKSSAVGGNITGNLTFQNIVSIDTSTVRAEYMTVVSSGITSGPIFDTMNGLDQKTTFGTTNLTYKVDFVPLAVKNRWHDGNVRLPAESYRSSLREPDSEDFKKFKNMFETMLREQLLRSVPVVRQVVIKDVRFGSIVVPFAVETNENSTNTTTQSLRSALDTVTSIGDYTVDPNEDSKSMTDSVYISGLQRLDPVPKDQLPALAIPSRDGEDITTGTVSLDNKYKAPVRRNNYFLTVTIPSFAALLFGIIIFLCCTATATRMMNNNNAKNVP
ncbi:mucin-21-like isoform X4 [Macrobrachium rosenbergii]|uniref:mucin-21-like isoform X4 n=1 Tax=Macrobrachium rosenbergii TaxID=79674 RepID=UPI0034D447AE